MMARASATRRCSPPESSPGRGAGTAWEAAPGRARDRSVPPEPCLAASRSRVFTFMVGFRQAPGSWPTNATCRCLKSVALVGARRRLAAHLDRARGLTAPGGETPGARASAWSCRLPRARSGREDPAFHNAERRFFQQNLAGEETTLSPSTRAFRIVHRVRCHRSPAPHGEAHTQWPRRRSPSSVPARPRRSGRSRGVVPHHDSPVGLPSVVDSCRNAAVLTRYIAATKRSPNWVRTVDRRFGNTSRNTRYGSFSPEAEATWT